jgi:hypothetical protein
LNTSEQYTLFDLDTPSGKTSQEFSARTTTPLAASWARLSAARKPSWRQGGIETDGASGSRNGSQSHTMSLENGDGAGTKYSSSGRHGAVSVWLLDPSEQHAGESLMPNISAWPNDASACSLSSVLETGLIPEKYYLSGKACDGILRRAERRGKALPAALRDALVAVANGRQKSAPPSTRHGLTDQREAKRRSGTAKKVGDSSRMSDSPSTRKAGGLRRRAGDTATSICCD